MVKVELSYNPYLLDTQIKFNGNAPRINSLIEKYSGGSLYNWIDMMPQILHDEMNGYDFEIEFTGTQKDFEAISNVFEGISSVSVFYKNNIDGRHSKNESVDNLLEWLAANPNRQFNYDLFRKDNAELFDTEYSFIILNGGKVDEAIFDGLSVSVDNIEDINTIGNTDLTDVPVLICIDKESWPMLEDNIRLLMKRTDVEKRQLFFLIHPSIKATKVKRILQDLNIKNPQIIDSNDVQIIKNYMELFPTTEYIRNVIKLFNSHYQKMRSDLVIQMKNNEIANRDTKVEVENLSKGIDSIKHAIELLEGRDNINIPGLCYDEKNNLVYKIRNWRKRKTKITSDGEAEKYSAEFEQDIRKYVKEFETRIDSIFNRKKEKMKEIYRAFYKSAGFDVNYTPNINQPENIRDVEVEHLANKLLKLKHEMYVEQKDIFDNFFSQPTVNELVREVIYYNEEWRSFTENNITPKVNEYIESSFKVLCDYESRYVDDLINHLNNILEVENTKKQSVINQMSEVDRELQNDAEWLNQLFDKIESIMKG